MTIGELLGANPRVSMPIEIGADQAPGSPEYGSRRLFGADAKKTGITHVLLHENTVASLKRRCDFSFNAQKTLILIDFLGIFLA